MVGPSLDIDYRDNPFLPSKGSFTRLTLDYSHPDIGSSDKPRIEFVKADGTYSHYLRLGSPNVVWANSLRAGYISNLSNKPDSGIPTSYAFFLGGIQSVRGYDIASDANRIPKEGDGSSADWPDGLQVKKQTQILFNKDSHYYLIKSELRFPLYNEHGGVIFYDGGAVKISGYKFRDTYRDAIGFGYRYNTPVGPVALDFAFKINPQPKQGEVDKEEKFRFHLSIGTF
jgi:outer membrane protein assembly factor BamA